MTYPKTATYQQITEGPRGGHYSIIEISPDGMRAASGSWDTPEEAFAALDPRELALLGTEVHVMHVSYEVIRTTTTTETIVTL